MGISYNQKYEKCGNHEIDKRGNHLTIKDSFKCKIFYMFHPELHQNRIEYHGSDEILYESFYELSDFGGNKQSNRYSYDIVLQKKRDKFLEHINHEYIKR